MYQLSVYDFSSQENKVLSSGTMENMLLLMESATHDYILSKQGDVYGTDYRSFIYRYGDSPNRSRANVNGAFYIEIDKYDPLRYVIREKKKIYGWFWNSFTYINHLEFAVIKKSSVPEYDKHFNNLYEWMNPFNEVLNELVSSVPKKEHTGINILFEC